MMTHRTGYRLDPRRPLCAALALALLALGACTAERPAPIACNVEPYLRSLDNPAPGLRRAGAGLSVAAPMSEYERALMASMQQAMAPPSLAVDGAEPFAPQTLALSGGGPWGAYGAGFLKGWKDRLGDIPAFASVTGVSTGALQAPFAFLGGEQLDALDTLYRNITNESIFTKRNPVLALLSANAFNSTEPLRGLIRGEIVKGGLIEKIAKDLEKHPGRTLFVGMVDLDSGELLAADLTALATGPLGAPGKLACFTELLIASAAVPVAFDPVATLDAGASRRRLLVDGGVRASAFVAAAERVATMLGGAERAGPGFAGETVVVVNGSLEFCPQTTKGGILSIGTRSISALTNQNVRNSLANIVAQRADRKQCLRYTHVAPLGDLCDIDANSTSFNSRFMNALADRGRAQWDTASPFETVGTCPPLPL